MSVGVGYRLMPVPMRVFIAHKKERLLVLMPMVVVMLVLMLMFKCLMGVIVMVPLGQVHPDAQDHERSSRQQPPVGLFIEERDRKRGT
jgi:biopolymer transport protein ExbD